MRSFGVVTLAGIAFMSAVLWPAPGAEARPLALALDSLPAPVYRAAVKKQVVKAVRVKQRIKLRKIRQQEMRGLNPQPEPPGQFRTPGPTY